MIFHAKFLQICPDDHPSKFPCFQIPSVCSVDPLPWNLGHGVFLKAGKFVLLCSDGWGWPAREAPSNLPELVFWEVDEPTLTIWWEFILEFLH